jgi:hypothetical protein
MNTSELTLSNETKQKVYLVGIIGAGDVGRVAREIGCDESNIILVENEKDIPFRSVYRCFFDTLGIGANDNDKS